MTVRLLRIPSIDDEEIRKIMRIESAKHVPYADEDIVSGYRVAEKTADGYSSVLLAVTRREVVDRLTGIAAKAGSPDVPAVVLSSEALLLWYLRASVGKKAGESVCIVNIDTDHIDINIVEDERLVFTRGIVYGEKAAFTGDKVVSEVRVSAASYRKESDRTVSKIVLTGVQANAAGCREMLERELKVPVELTGQSENIPLGEGIGIDNEETSFAELIGLALFPDGTRINLLPGAVQEEKRLAVSKKNIAVTVVIIFMINAVAVGVVFKKLHDKTLCIYRIESESREISPRVERAAKMVKEMKIIRERMEESPLAIDIVSELVKVTPQGISFSMLEFESKKSLTIRGSAGALADVFSYVNVLELSPYFEKVKVKYANKRASVAGESADFELLCLLSDGKAKGPGDGIKKSK